MIYFPLKYTYSKQFIIVAILRTNKKCNILDTYYHINIDSCSSQ